MVDNHDKERKLKSSLKEKILKYLIENKEKPVTIRKISQAINVDYKNTFHAINGLSDLIYKEKFGNTNLIEINLKPDKEIFSVEYKRTKQFLEENKQLKLIQGDLKEINYPFFIVLVFGSVVKKTKTEKSDIDICVICDNETKKKELISKLNLLPLKLEIHDFSVKEFESMLEVKKENIAKEIIKNNLIFYGAESYYNLISKWMEKE